MIISFGLFLTTCEVSYMFWRSWVTSILTQYIPYTGDPCYLRTFYLQICLFTLTKLIKNDNFLVKNGLLSANSVFGVQNDGTYLPRITSETCIQNIPNIPCFEFCKNTKVGIFCLSQGLKRNYIDKLGTFL